jgi:hypothetical protein
MNGVVNATPGTDYLESAVKPDIASCAGLVLW